MTFFRSPLFRHPTLLARKAAQRLQGHQPFTFSPCPTGAAWKAHDSLAPFLRAWAAASDLHDVVVPPNRIFRQEFELAELFDRCLSGPNTGTGLEADVKLIWEFSRAYHLVLNAARPATQAAGDAASFITTWLDTNRDPNGHAWTNAMEVALRAVTWICADALYEGALRKSLGMERWLQTMHDHGSAIMARLEAKRISSNHYLANLLGLAYIGAHLDTLQGRAWLHFARGEFPRALAAQSHQDGGAWEASLPYHALIMEMAVLFAVLHEPISPGLRTSLDKGLQIVADFSCRGGDVFPFGDDDGGRVIAFDFASRSMGRADVLLKAARILLGRDFIPQSDALYESSGWWTCRRGELHAACEFGGVGFAGQGAHAHNDRLSFALNLGGHAVFTDPGSYIYSPDPAARNAFRSTFAHSVLVIDRWEQLPLPEGGGSSLFMLPGTDVAATVVDHQPGRLTVEDFPHRRSLAVTPASVEITDDVSGAGPRHLAAQFVLHPSITVTTRDNTAELKLPDGRGLRFTAPEGLEVRLRDGVFSPFYGTRESTRLLVVELSCSLPARLLWRVDVTT